ncbi:LOW QUALITY PROTEIN: hypothetical protein ACHAXS_014413, partial [Conticribra weissflogii]
LYSTGKEKAGLDESLTETQFRQHWSTKNQARDFLQDLESSEPIIKFQENGLCSLSQHWLIHFYSDQSSSVTVNFGGSISNLSALLGIIMRHAYKIIADVIENDLTVFENRSLEKWLKRFGTIFLRRDFILFVILLVV